MGVCKRNGTRRVGEVNLHDGHKCSLFSFLRNTPVFSISVINLVLLLE